MEWLQIYISYMLYEKKKAYQSFASDKNEFRSIHFKCEATKTRGRRLKKKLSNTEKKKTV